MEQHERIGRGRQIFKLWSFINFDDDEATNEDKVVDILTDLYHFCRQEKISWVNVVSNAEKWGLKESMAHSNSLNEMSDGQAQRLLDAIFNADPLSANDPDEEEDND